MFLKSTFLLENLIEFYYTILNFNLDGYTPFGARLLLIHCSVILRVLGVPAEDLGFESPLCRLPLIPDIVVDICKGTCSWEGWLVSTSVVVGSAHRCMQFIHEKHLYDRWRCVSLEEKARCRDTWRRNPPITSSYRYSSVAGG